MVFTLIIGYFLIQFVIFIILLLWSKRKDKRLYEDQGTIVPEGYEPTNEIYIDPISRQTYKVYFNKKNGKRFHKKE